MVYEGFCDVCGKLEETKYCKIRKINVCAYCCVACEQRSTCDIRVWFRNLIPVTASRPKVPKASKEQKRQSTLF